MMFPRRLPSRSKNKPITLKRRLANNEEAEKLTSSQL